MNKTQELASLYRVIDRCNDRIESIRMSIADPHERLAVIHEAQRIVEIQRKRDEILKIIMVQHADGTQEVDPSLK